MEKASLPGMEVQQGERSFLSPFVHRRTKTADPVTTKVLSKLSPLMAMLFAPFGTSPCPTLSGHTEPISQRHCRKWNHEAESFMPDIAGYIQESANHMLPQRLCWLNGLIPYTDIFGLYGGYLIANPITGTTLVIIW